MDQSKINKDILLIEAMRAGIPSRLIVNSIPNLRGDLIDQIDNDLDALSNREKLKGRLIWGDYGQGKTHFLKSMEKHILDKGFAVSYISLNRDLGLNNIHNTYTALTSHLLTYGSSIPGLLNKLTEKIPHPNLMKNLEEIEMIICHPLPSFIFREFMSYNSNNMLLCYNTLMGKKENLTKVKSLLQANSRAQLKNQPKFIQREHLISFFEFLPFLLKELGYKGWVIMIDELEIVGKFGKVGRLNSYKNLSWLLNWNNQHNLPIYTLVASASALREDVFFGKKKYDADEMPNLAIEKLNKEDAKSVESFFDNITDNRNLVLKPITSRDTMPLMMKLMEIHQKAIPWKSPASESFIEDALHRIDPSSKPIRQTVRIFIEIMDIYAKQAVMPGSINDNLIDVYEFNDDLDEGDENLDSNSGNNMGFREIKLEDMFD